MTQQQASFDNFYDARVEAHRQLYPRENIFDRWSRPSITLSVLAVLVAILVKLYGSDTSLEDAVSSVVHNLWDGLVFIVPTRLLVAVDTWANPPTLARPMSETTVNTHAAKSEVMRRVMGLDRTGGMMATVFRARSRALSARGGAFGFKLDSYRPPGLGNRDNSCYQNSILQGLASLQSFPEYLNTCIRTFDIQKTDKDVSHTLQSLIADLNDSSNNGKTLWTPGLLKSMSTWTQQDAQEYYSKILDDIDKGVARAVEAAQQHPGLEEDAAKDEATSSQHSDDSGYQSLSSSSKLSDTKPMRNPLEGLLAQRVACIQCGHSDGLSMIPFNCLTLSLGLDNNRHDLYERLDSYSSVEAIEGVECPKCTLLKMQRLLTKLSGTMREGGSTKEQLTEPMRRLEAVEAALEDDEFDDKTMAEKCKITAQNKVTTTKTKQIVIARPPQSLVIHMNRSVFDPATFNMMKNSAPVDFPMTLDLGPWCLGSADSSSANPELEETAGGVEGSEEQWQSDPKASMIAGDLGSSRLTGPIYELKAAVTHYGRHENGHYICYRKYPRGKEPGFQPDAVTEEQAGVEVDADADAEGQTTPKPGAPSLDTEDIDDERTEPKIGEDETNGQSGDTDEETAWWRLSDHNVSKIDEETVLSLSPGVFMLFYECVDSSMVLQADNEAMHDTTEATETGAPPSYEEDESTHGRSRDAGDAPFEQAPIEMEELTIKGSPELVTDIAVMTDGSNGLTAYGRAVKEPGPALIPVVSSDDLKT